MWIHLLLSGVVLLGCGSVQRSARETSIPQVEVRVWTARPSRLFWHTPEVELAGPLPGDIQSCVTFSAAVSASGASLEAARQLIEFLRGPAAARVILAQGMERPPF